MTSYMITVVSSEKEDQVKADIAHMLSAKHDSIHHVASYEVSPSVIIYTYEVFLYGDYLPPISYQSFGNTVITNVDRLPSYIEYVNQPQYTSNDYIWLGIFLGVVISIIVAMLIATAFSLQQPIEHYNCEGGEIILERSMPWGQEFDRLEVSTYECLLRSK